MESVADWSIERKLEETLLRALPKLGPEVRSQLAALLTAENLAAIGVVLITWVASHAFGVGEAIDLIIVAVGVLGLGMSVFRGLDHLYSFAVGTYRARSTVDLDVAAGHFANAIGILGVQAVLAVLFRGAPKTYRAGLPRRMGPVTARGVAYRPTIRWTQYEPGVGQLREGSGWTTSWGDIVVSSRGSAQTRQIVLFHELVHQALTPKLQRLRNFRIANRDASYSYSSLSRYLEEGLAEAVARARVFGAQHALLGIRFPTQHQYVYLLRSGSGMSTNLRGSGVLPELAGLVIGAVQAAGVRYDVFVGRTADAAPPVPQRAAPAEIRPAPGAW